MSKVWQIAGREFVATVFTKGFVIGLLIVPAVGVLLALVMPRLFGDRSFTVEGEIAVIDPTGVVLSRVREAMAARGSPAAVTELVENARAGGAADVIVDMLGATTRLTLVERSQQADVEEEEDMARADNEGRRDPRRLEEGAPHHGEVVAVARPVEDGLAGKLDAVVGAGEVELHQALMTAVPGVVGCRGDAGAVPEDELGGVAVVVGPPLRADSGLPATGGTVE